MLRRHYRLIFGLLALCLLLAPFAALAASTGASLPSSGALSINAQGGTATEPSRWPELLVLVMGALAALERVLQSAAATAVIDLLKLVAAKGHHEVSASEEAEARAWLENGARALDERYAAGAIQKVGEKGTQLFGILFAQATEKYPKLVTDGRLNTLIHSAVQRAGLGAAAQS